MSGRLCWGLMIVLVLVMAWSWVHLVMIINCVTP